jgi:hypothetical protein
MRFKNYFHAKVKDFRYKQFHLPYPTLEDMLPYEDFFEYAGLNFVFLKNGSLGLGLKVQWPNHLTSSDKALIDLEEATARFLQRVNADYQIQFQLIKKSGNFEGYVFFRSPRMQVVRSFVPQVMQKTSLETFQVRAEELKSIVEAFSSTIQSEGACAKFLDSSAYLFLLSNCLGGSHLPTSFQNLSNLSGNVTNSTLTIGEKNYSVIVPVSLSQNITTQVLRPLFFENYDFTISVGLRILSREETEMRINNRKFWLQNSLGASAARLRQELTQFEKEFTNGARLVASTLAVLTDNKSAIQAKNILCQATQSVWTVESAGASKVILDTLPFNHDQTFMERIGRCVYLPDSTCCRLFPLSTGSLSKKERVLKYPSIEGELTGFDLRDTPGCHTAVIAGTRSGKSFLVANILHRYLSSDNPPVVSIIDKRASYETLTHYHGGAVVAFTPEKLKSPDFPFHPLAGALDEGHIEFLCSYLSLLAELAKPDEPIYAVDKVVITEALRNAVESLKVSAQLTGSLILGLTMSDIVSALGRNSNSVARALAARLKPYYGTGTYAAYFDRETKCESLDLDILSFDLDGLENDTLLQSAMSQAILGQVMARMRKASKNGRWGILLIEEIGVLGDSINGLSQFVSDAWKTLAKMGVVCIGVTNDVEDYLHKPTAKAIWNNSPNKIYLRMTHDQIRSLISSNEHSPAVVNGQLAELLPCLKTIPGEKADFILTSEERIYPLVFKPNQKSYWLGTSKHEDILKIKKLTQTMSLHDAIEKLTGDI